MNPLFYSLCQGQNNNLSCVRNGTYCCYYRITVRIVESHGISKKNVWRILSVQNMTKNSTPFMLSICSRMKGKSRHPSLIKISCTALLCAPSLSSRIPNQIYVVSCRVVSPQYCHFLNVHLSSCSNIVCSADFRAAGSICEFQSIHLFAIATRSLLFRSSLWDAHHHAGKHKLREHGRADYPAVIASATTNFSLHVFFAAELDVG